MNFCQRCRAQLGEFLDGTLSPSAQENVAAHLQTCADCAREKRVIEATRAALNDLKPVAAPPELRLRVRAALQNEAAQRAKQKPEWGSSFSFLRPQKFAWAGTLALSAFTLLILARPFANRPLTFHDTTPTASEEPATEPSQAAKATAGAVKPKVQNRVTASKPAPSLGKPTVKPALPQQPAASPERENASSIKPAPAFPAPASGADVKSFQAPAFSVPRKAPVESIRRSITSPTPSEAHRPVAPVNPFGALKVAPSPVTAPAPTGATAMDRTTSAGAGVGGGRPRVMFSKATGFSVEISAVAQPAVAQPQDAPFNETVPNAPMTPLLRADGGPGAVSKKQGGFGDNANALSAAPLGAPAPAPAAAALPAPMAPQVFKFRGGPAQPPAAPPEVIVGGQGTVNGAVHDENTARMGALESKQAASAMATTQNSTGLKPNFDIAVPNLPKTYSLRIKAPQAVKNAQIRVELPATVHFLGADSGSSRVLWTGDFEIGQPVQIYLSVVVSSPGEKITIFLEQNEPGAQSKALETQTLPLP